MSVSADDYDRATFLDGDENEWQAYLDGDVYGVGVLVNADHVGWGDDEQTPADEGDGWTWDDGPVWGHYGDDYAARTAVDEADHVAARLSASRPLIGSEG